MCDQSDLTDQNAELSAIYEMARRYSDEFKTVFCEEGKLVPAYVSANESLFMSRYAALISAFSEVSQQRSMFLSIFFTWVKVELFIYRYEWTRDSFLPFYDHKSCDDIFWNSLLVTTDGVYGARSLKTSSARPPEEGPWAFECRRGPLRYR